MNVVLPEHLYKYLPLRIEFDEKIEYRGVKRQKNGFDALADILINNKIYYSKPRYFNDPFELDSVILKLSENEKEKIRKRTIDHLIKSGELFIAPENKEIITVCSEDDFHESAIEYHNRKSNLFNRCGFISLSRSNKKTLMWSHYSDSHRGVCLRYKCIDDSFYSQNGSGRVIEVKYDDRIITKELNLVSNNFPVFEKISRKACCWSYEGEFRVFKVPSKQKADDTFGNHFFNSQLVDAVYFGLKTCDDDKQKVINIIRSAKHKINLYQAIKHKTKLKIEFIKINPA